MHLSELSGESGEFQNSELKSRRYRRGRLTFLEVMLFWLTLLLIIHLVREEGLSILDVLALGAAASGWLIDAWWRRNRRNKLEPDSRLAKRGSRGSQFGRTNLVAIVLFWLGFLLAMRMIFRDE